MVSHLNKNRLIMSHYTSKGIMSCELCYSSDFAESKLGLVCRVCGAVIEQKQLKYNTPYNESAVHHAPLTAKTQIGTVFERINAPNSTKLRALVKANKRYNNLDHQVEIGRVEIARIFHTLQLPHRLKREVFLMYCETRNRLTPGTKYRSPATLAAVVVYIMMKLRKISIDQNKILEVCNLSRKDFNEFKLKIYPLFKDYAKRDRKAYVSQKILQLSEQFKLGMRFYFQSRKLLDGLWEQIKNTSDEVVAGLIASLTLLTQGSDEVTVSAICKKLGIMPSTIHSQVRKHLVNKYEMKGYKSLIKSRELIKDILLKLELIEVA